MRKVIVIIMDNLKKAIQLLDRWFINRGSTKEFLDARNLILKEEQKIIKEFKIPPDKYSRGREEKEDVI